MKKLGLKEFQLSQNYLFFYDKLNKSNYYLELAIENADKALDERLISHLNSDIISDGGQWDMAVCDHDNISTLPFILQPGKPLGTLWRCPTAYSPRNSPFIALWARQLAIEDKASGARADPAQAHDILAL
jgi:bleomycin hydrolase